MNKIFTLTFLVIISVNAFGQDMYFPPEFEKQEGLLLTWDYNDSRNPITAAIAKAVQPSARVWVIYYPGTAPMDTTEIRDYLRNHSVPDANVFLIPAWTETLWIRDYGPFAGYNLEVSSPERLFFDAGYSNYGRPNDDAIPTQLGDLMNIAVQDFPLQFEGGNVLTDGLGRAWGSTRIFSQNPQMTPKEVEVMMESYFGIDDMMFLEAVVNSGGGIWCHVDMFMKILDSETIMISEYPDFVPDYALIESFVDTLSKMTNANGRAYQIVRIPAPPKANGQWATSQNDEMRTYTNSIIINDVVVVPSYDLPIYDSLAFQIYSEQMPGYRIEMVEAVELTPLYGSLHCISKEVTKADFLKINHAKLCGMKDYTDPFFIETEIWTDGQPDSAFVFYKTLGEPNFNKTALTASGDVFKAALANIEYRDTITYFLSVFKAGDQTNFPTQGAGGAYTFWFDPSVDIRESVLSNNETFDVFPNPASQAFSIGLSLDDFPYHLDIFNAMGKSVFQAAILQNYQFIPVATNLPNGLYYLQLQKDARILGRQKLLIIK